jgi:HAD superfamily hydrolase (TIGR01509 family)
MKDSKQGGKDMIQLAEFDFDGTMVFTEQVYMKHLMERLSNAGIVYTKKDLAALSGSNPVTRDLIMEECFHDQKAYQDYKNNPPKSQKWPEIHMEELVAPNLEEALKYLKEKGVHIVICTNSDEQRIWKYMKELHLDSYIEKVYSGYDLNHNKPDPYIYELAMKDFGCTEQETIVFEDAKMGIEGARKSGAYVVALEDPMQICDQSAAHEILHGWKNIAALVEKLESEEKTC